jgi:predicted O-methyltransferase YrrM
MVIGGRLKEVVRSARRAQDHDAPQAFPAGAFYSPVVNAAEVLSEPEASRIWPAEVLDPPGIDFRAAAQLALLQELAMFRFSYDPIGTGPHYDPANDQFPPHDAALLYAMVRHLRPRRMVEVGCGWSTTVTAAAIQDGDIGTQLTCIEPYPREFLHEMGRVLTLRQEKVEHTPFDVFAQLESGDILFIDSSHVVKTGSDVVHQLLEVVPRLSDGVIVHVHDIFIPEDYPQGWVRNGFGWTEQYLLQAFLVGNARAHVLAMNRWLALRHPDAVATALGAMELHGSSVWFVTGSEPAR